MRMKITAPAQVGGEPVEIGDVVDVKEPGEIARLLHFGQAVEEPEPTTDHYTPATDWDTGDSEEETQ
nr:MAG TPA: hypothetical protein [Siphoviridae sp. ctvS314]